jgi:hypothetical protein
VSFKKIGLNTDTYMSLIDPDYPVIISGWYIVESPLLLICFRGDSLHYFYFFL